MTAEIAILNKMGVALAADSAVSIGRSGKVYNSANKLFALSKKHPVAIMIYGNAHFISVPWEVIIKNYRANELGATSFPLLKNYLDSFLKYLTKTNILPKEDEVDYVNSYARMIFNKIKNHIDQEMEEFFKKQNKATIKKAIALREMRKIIASWISQETGRKRDFLSLTSREKNTLKRQHKLSLESQLSHFLSTELLLPLANTVREKIINIIYLDLISTNFISPSGLVIAGFGDDEIFPSTFQVSIEGSFFSISKLKMTDPKSQVITGKMPASIAPFAQREMVDTFMCGIDPKYKNAVNLNLKNEFESLNLNVLSKIGLQLTAAQSAALDAELKKRTDALLNAYKDIEHKAFVQPVLNSVAALPLDELAAMAEALVNLTSFKRRVTIVPESVGGPIDVAVISKGDGFIWINRKHYFKPELNPHFFQR